MIAYTDLKYFENEKFGAIFSFSVLEHTVMPWVVALEMIKLVELGGLILAHVPSALPPHEQPSDFWRISPDGLKVLFSPSLGMNVEAVLYDHPLHMYLDNPVPGQEMLPTNPAYSFAGILARKVSEIDYSQYKWFSSHEEVIGRANFYPAPIK